MSTVQVTVSGSFRRYLPQVQEAVNELTQAGAVVLSPASPVVVDAIEGFVFVESDPHRSPRLVQDRHLAAIVHSQFVWLVCPDGYVGQSAALEVGYAIAMGIPVFATNLPSDLTMRQYVTLVPSCAWAVRVASEQRRAPPAAASLLLDPVSATQAIHDAAERLRTVLTAPAGKAASELHQKLFDTERLRIVKLAEASRTRH